MCCVSIELVYRHFTLVYVTPLKLLCMKITTLNLKFHYNILNQYLLSNNFLNLHCILKLLLGKIHYLTGTWWMRQTRMQRENANRIQREREWMDTRSATRDEGIPGSCLSDGHTPQTRAETLLVDVPVP